MLILLPAFRDSDLEAGSSVTRRGTGDGGQGMGDGRPKTDDRRPGHNFHKLRIRLIRPDAVQAKTGDWVKIAQSWMVKRIGGRGTEHIDIPLSIMGKG